VLSTLVDSGNYEAAINNIFNTGSPDTGRIYVSFSGIVTPGNNITLPTLFQRTEDSLPGWTLVEEIYLCSGSLYCDGSYWGGNGTGIGADGFAGGRTGNDYVTLSAIAPSQPFTITEVFHIVNDGVTCCHLAGAIVVDPNTVACPAPSRVQEFPACSWQALAFSAGGDGVRRSPETSRPLIVIGVSALRITSF